MCGIAGYWPRSKADPGLAKRMGESLTHRGPDGSGEWIDPETGIAFAHRRLAIVDLSPAGHQPMLSANGRWVLSYNGEIYNHGAIRSELEAEGATPQGGWRGHSDTETLVEAIAHWGLERALERSVGMFALALWDRRERRLFLARDRFGEKPLYYGRAGKDFVFASELKAIRVHPDFDPAIDREALASYAALGVVPGPLSIYRAIAKLPPGSILTLESPGAEPRIEPYWSYRKVVVEGLADPIRDERDAVDALDDALRQAIAGQSVADVPVGAFLSGGIDSSTVVATYQAVSGRPVRTYTIGFDEAGFDESGDARRVAEHLGTEHHEHRVGVAEAQDVIPLLPAIYDEPFADSSQIPTFIVSRFARRDVTVAISGDGGDELFAGYNRHRAIPALWERVGKMPSPVRRTLGNVAGFVPEALAARSLALVGGHRAELAAKALKMARVAGPARSLEGVYHGLLDQWRLSGDPVAGVQARMWPLDLPAGLADSVRLTTADALGYLPDDILVKVDRAAMAVSLETRVPFLDHRVAAVAARIDPSLKIRGGKGKWVLRRLLERHVPRDLFDRPKAGFAIPIGGWLRGPLREWVESLIDPQRLAEEGNFDTGVVRRRWEAHLAGSDETPALWAVLMFQAWLDSARSD